MPDFAEPVERLIDQLKHLPGIGAKTAQRLAFHILRAKPEDVLKVTLARSLGELGATLLFAGNLTGRTQTLPLAVYTAMESDLRGAQALSLVMVALALLVLLVVRKVQRA